MIVRPVFAALSAACLAMTLAAIPMARWRSKMAPAPAAPAQPRPPQQQAQIKQIR